MKTKHAIFGFGPVGHTLASRLVAAGDEVTIISRRGSTIPGARAYKADANDQAMAREAAKGADVVYNCTNAEYTRWPEELPPLYTSILRAAISNDAKYVYTDNLYMYGPVTGPMDETLPDRPAGPKAEVRSRLGLEVLAANKQIPTVILRSSDYYGPLVEQSLLSVLGLSAMAKGKALPALGDIDQPHAFTYVPDLAHALEIVGKDDRANGQVWFTPTAVPVSTREMIVLFAKDLGAKPKIMVAKRPMLRFLGLFNPMMKTLVETLYQWEAPYLLNSTKFEQTFGLKSTPLAEGITETSNSIRGNP
ncbi:MAG: NAD-dependent epimerase/dehydratase family protein [Fimbriimonas sp.]